MSWLSNAVKSPRGIADENQIFSHGQVQSRKPRRLRRGTSHFQKGIRDFYEEPITYRNSKFTFSGTTDFLVSKGLEFSETPYFFIQEFKKSIKNDDPRPQLLAEMISAIELNSWTTIKGAYIVGSIWHFVILSKIREDSYQYTISENFDSSKIEDLKGIYKNLLYIKDTILSGLI
jgi:hypothetical protein